MLALGAVGSIAYQSHAQTAPTPLAQSATVSQNSADTNTNDGVVDQKDQNGKDIETNDDNSTVSNSSTSVNSEKSHAGDTEQGESANDADGGANED